MADFEWIDEDNALQDVLAEIAKEPSFALDTEFHRERSYFPELALVQLGWRDRIALVDPLAVDVTPLKQLLDSDATCIIHAASQDLLVLHLACGMVPRHLFDPQIAALFCGLGVSSLGKLVQEFLNVRLDKSGQLSDWRRRPLPPSDLRYAASDVAHLHALREKILTVLEKRGRVAWAAEEIERSRTKDQSLPDPDTRWWKLKGKGRLSGSARGVAQSLAAWRELTAREEDKTVKSVLADMALLGIANRPPKKKQDLARIRGVDGRHLGRADEILEAVARGQRLSRDELRLPPTSPKGENSSSAVVALCAGWVSQQANTHNIDPSMLATRDDINHLLSGQPSRLDEGWRHDLVGAELRSLIDGKRALVVERGKLVSVDRVQ